MSEEVVNLGIEFITKLNPGLHSASVEKTVKAVVKSVEEKLLGESELVTQEIRNRVEFASTAIIGVLCLAALSIRLETDSEKKGK